MATLSNFGSTNTTNKILQNATMEVMENETAGGSVQLELFFTVGTIIINGIACPFTVLLNVLVIMAVKKRPNLQSNTNILLACLAVTDLLTGLIVQPSFVTWKAFYLLTNVNITAVKEVHNLFLCVLTISSSLHLMLITCERLIAIKYTNHYLYIVRKRNFKVSVLAIWSFSFMTGVLKENADLLAAPVADILNSSFLERRLPTSWKKADITPLPKTSLVSDVNKHLRPISLTPILSKEGEEFVVDGYIKPAVLAKIDQNQYGTVPNSSTCLLYTSPSPRDGLLSRMPSSA